MISAVNFSEAKWVQGTLSSAGSETSSGTQIRCAFCQLPQDKHLTFKVVDINSQPMTATIYFYTELGGYISSMPLTDNEYFMPPAEAKLFRIVANADSIYDLFACICFVEFTYSTQPFTDDILCHRVFKLVEDNTVNAENYLYLFTSSEEAETINYYYTMENKGNGIYKVEQHESRVK